MTSKHTLSAKKRDLKVKNAHYRQDGYVLANVYGEAQSQPLILPSQEILKLLPEVSESTVIYLSIAAAAPLPVMISEIQRNPITNQVLHLALRQVNLKEKVTAMIPIETTGAFDVADAVYLLVKDEVEAEALPTDLPEKFVVDVSTFKAIGEQFTFADLNYDRQKVTLQLDHDDEPIVVVNAVKEEVEEAPPAAAEEATEATANAPSEATPAATPTPESK